MEPDDRFESEIVFDDPLFEYLFTEVNEPEGNEPGEEGPAGEQVA